jgi:hypothetical protein
LEKIGNIVVFEEYGAGWTHNIPKKGIGRAENFHGCLYDMMIINTDM